MPKNVGVGKVDIRSESSIHFDDLHRARLSVVTAIACSNTHFHVMKRSVKDNYFQGAWLSAGCLGSDN